MAMSALAWLQGWHCAYGQWENILFSIEESGPSHATNWDLRISLRPISSSASGLRLPSGEQLKQDSTNWDPVSRSWSLPFASIDEIYSQLEGQWALTFGNVNILDILFVDVPSFELSRSQPIALSLSPGDVLRNGQQFALGWDYAEPDAPSQSVVRWDPQFVQGTDLGPAEFVQGRTGYYSQQANQNYFFAGYSEGIGDYANNTIFRLTTYRSAVPLDVDFSIAALTSLNDAVMTGRNGAFMPGADPRLTSSVGLRYLRISEQFRVRLLEVPEPTASLLFACSLVGLAAYLRRLNQPS